MQNLVVREAILDDRAAIASWYADVVRHSFHRKPLIVSKDQHTKWFESVRNDKENRLLCIGLVDIIRVAAIQFNRVDCNKFSCTFLIRSPYLGMGLSSQLLTKGFAFLSERWPGSSMQAKVPNSNSASLDIIKEEGLEVSEVKDGFFEVRLGGTK